MTKPTIRISALDAFLQNIIDAAESGQTEGKPYEFAEVHLLDGHLTEHEEGLEEATVYAEVEAKSLAKAPIKTIGEIGPISQSRGRTTLITTDRSSIDKNGDAKYYALVNSKDKAVIATAAIKTQATVSEGNFFTLDPFTISIEQPE